MKAVGIVRVKFEGNICWSVGGKLGKESFCFDAHTVWGANKIGQRSDFLQNVKEAVANFVVGA